MKYFKEKAYRRCSFCSYNVEVNDIKEHVKSHQVKELARKKSEIEYKKFIKNFNTFANLKSIGHKNIEAAIVRFGKKVMLDIKVLSITDELVKHANSYGVQNSRRMRLNLSIIIKKDRTAIDNLKVNRALLIGNNKNLVDSVIHGMEECIRNSKLKENKGYIELIIRGLLRSIVDVSCSFGLSVDKSGEDVVYKISHMDLSDNFSKKNKNIANKEEELKNLCSSISVKKDFFSTKYKSSLKEQMMTSEISNIDFIILDDKRKKLQEEKKIIEEEERKVLLNMFEKKKQYLEEAIAFAGKEYSTELSEINKELEKAKQMSEEIGAKFSLGNEIETILKQVKSSLLNTMD